ncbi:MAG: hypothetical protein AAF518_27710 [Spirochaetota bacterium]
MSFAAEEIAGMLQDYETDAKSGMDTSLMSQEIHKFTNGYPYLVSKLCKLLDETFAKDWSIAGLQEAIHLLLTKQNTLFDDIVKNVENNTELFTLFSFLIIEEKNLSYSLANPLIDLSTMYGLTMEGKNKKLIVHNKIFEIFLYEYFVSKLETTRLSPATYNFQDNFVKQNGDLDMEKVLLKFQQFIKETYSNKDEEFYERQGLLLLIAFIKPIINGTGFYYIESQHSYERRSDMILTFNKKEYILELKIWHGEEYHKQGLQQLSGYLDSKGHNTGYLLVFNFQKNKEFTSQWQELDRKKIFQVMV